MVFLDLSSPEDQVVSHKSQFTWLFGTSWSQLWCIVGTCRWSSPPLGCRLLSAACECLCRSGGWPIPRSGSWRCWSARLSARAEQQIFLFLRFFCHQTNIRLQRHDQFLTWFIREMWIQPLGSTISNCCREKEETKEKIRSCEHQQAHKQTITRSRYPDLLQVVEVVPHSDRDLTGCVALIRFIVSVNTQHLHRRPPPE